MATFFGNLSDQIDFEELLRTLKPGYQEEFYAFDRDGNIPDDVNPDDKDYVERIHDAGYKDPICRDMLYYPHYHFNESLVYKLDQIFGSICNMCWINRALPGRVIIPHQDYDDREQILEKYGTMVRYHVHIGEPQPGHVFILDTHAHHMEASGNCYKWDHYTDWHSASNSGFDAKFILSYRGLVPHPEHRHRFEDFDYIWSDIAESVKIKINDPVEII